MLVGPFPEHVFVAAHKHEVSDDIISWRHRASPGVLIVTDGMQAQSRQEFGFPRSHRERDRWPQPPEDIMDSTSSAPLHECSGQEILLENPMLKQRAKRIDRIPLLLYPPGIGAVQCVHELREMVRSAGKTPLDLWSVVPDQNLAAVMP